MEGPGNLFEDQHDLPNRIFDRLRQIAGYTWDDSISPLHTSYDNWHVFGTRFVSPYSAASNALSPASNFAISPGSLVKLASSRTPPATETPLSTLYSAGNSESSVSPASNATKPDDTALLEEPVVARISFHVLREERAFHIAKSLSTSSDPNGDHIAKPIDLLRLPPQSGDRGPIVVAIHQHPGVNRIPKLLDQGPAFYRAHRVDDGWQIQPNTELGPAISLNDFLDFAIGATRCLEMIHHGQGIVHGEIRGDAFHLNRDNNRVKLLSFGSGLRSFEHGLTSTGWSLLSKELGAKNKLLYISPEQTGRMPAQADTRTDIYSLGVLMWSLLTQKPVFEGETPLDIVQGVLGKRIPNVSTVRMDIPEALGKIIQKCTAKNVGDRYHSATGLRHDLSKVREFLRDGDMLALKDWQIGSKDVSSFFILPAVVIGRDQEREQVVKVIDRVAKTQAMSRTGGPGSFSDGSSLSTEHLDGADASSEGASSGEGTNRRSGSFTQTVLSDPRPRNSFHLGGDTQTISGETMSSGHSSASRMPQRSWERHHQSVSLEARSLVESVGSSERDSARHSGVPTDASSSLSRQLGSAKFRRRGHCEIVTIEGIGGMGKSCLVQSILADARRRGYCASAKFDTTRRTAFAPLLKLLSSLFRQVWGERNTETPFHQSLKQYARPMWPMLHKLLGLPEFLLGPVDHSIARSMSSAQSSIYAKSARSNPTRRGSSPSSSARQSRVSDGSVISSRSSQDFLRSGASMKSLRLMNTFQDVLRMFANHKFICLCLDDLHSADAESLELITQMIAARLRMVLIVTYRPEEMTPENVLGVIQPSESEELPRNVGPTVTKIQLSPLGEEDINQYVAATLCQPKEAVAALAMVIQVKTAGNPFYMREMLSACYRKKCIWYDYHESQWHFDVNKVFEQFKGDSNYDILDTDFITSRLNELPPASRAILAWAALLGNAFSFELICRLLSGEFNYVDRDCPEPHRDHFHASYSQHDAVAGLQATIQACIITPTETEDRFQFAHDRYIQAAAGLKECNSRKMHFVIAQTLLQHYRLDAKSKDSTASHICGSVDIIKARVHKRRPYRTLLQDCARMAIENGARPTAGKYLGCAVALLQPAPWTDDGDDASYDETLQLYLRAAECYVYMGQHALANGVLEILFGGAKRPGDNAPAYVLQSRIYSQGGDAVGSLSCLMECLKGLQITGLDENPSFEKCDKEFERLSIMLQTTSREKIMNPPGRQGMSVAFNGALLAETISSAWWSDCLTFYHLSLIMLELHLSAGAFPQSGMAFLHMAMVALSRFNMVDFAVQLSGYSLVLLDRFKDLYSMARGYMIYANFVSHVRDPIGMTASQLEGSIEYGATAGDRISAILSVGLASQVKFFASVHYADLEAFCQFGCEEIPNWHQDSRGGTMLIAARQVARALQGKTEVSNCRAVMGDEHHDTLAYKQWLQGNTNNGNRSQLFYEVLEMVPLFLFGHYEQAVELGKKCLERAHLIWSARHTRLAMLFHGLALSGLVFRRRQDPRQHAASIDNEAEETVTQLRDLVKKIEGWAAVSDINYLAWARLLQAQISEMSLDHGQAIRQYEEVLDHASEHNFVFEEGLGNYLMAGIFIRQAARRSAKAALRDAVGLFRQLGATGVVDRIEEEHSLLLHGPTRNPRTCEAGVQTDFASDAPSAPYRAVADEGGDAAGEQPTPTGMAQLQGERIGVWRGSMQPEVGVGLPALDMIDLHAILQSSQVISSVLQVDQLLKTMCDVILQTCSGSATLAAIVVQDEGTSEWCVAASGDPEKGADAHVPRIPLTGTHLVAENVVLYSTRFREAVFTADLLSDERFGNVSECWVQKHPLSKAVIAIPICHGSSSLLGVLYLEGTPGSFTDRNVTVLQLLVNQIGISYSNALSMKAIEKVSAENVSMVVMQKQALARSIEAENKAKKAEQAAKLNLELAKAAEVEAKRNVKLAEDAAKAKGLFLANISHELRTPLNGVIGNSELLRDSNLSNEQQEMAESIRLSADLLLTVINDILDFSRMEADKMKLYIIAFNPKEMVQEVVRAVSYRNQEKTARGVVEIIKQINLPPDVLVYGDPVRLHQVLGNLIGNSMKFTEKGSITIGACVDSETDDKASLTFWVEDTGIGIPPAQLAKLFQPFSQADASTARKYGGSGLGLSICKSLIETIMKGRIFLESRENVGTKVSFTVVFDKAQPEVSAGDVQTKAAPPMSLSASSSRSSSSMSDDRGGSPNPFMDLSQVTKEQLRVCIAEDNPINCKIAMQFLQRLGYTHVDAYENGELAVAALREAARTGRHYHVVLMDVQMPVLDGYAATKLLRKDALESVRKALVIAMTASAISGDREKCLAAGMNDYLAKPVKQEVLRRKLDAYIGVAPPRGGTGSRTHSSSHSRTSSQADGRAPSQTGHDHATTAAPRLAAAQLALEARASHDSLARGGVNGTTTPLVDGVSPTPPSRVSSDGHADSAEASAVPPPLPAKRLPRKLTKSRGNSEVGVDGKQKAVLQKKARGWDAGGGVGGAERLEDGKRSQSFASSVDGVGRED